MTDPACLLDSSVDEFERALLGSARQDVGSNAAKVRCIAAVSPAAVLIATSQSSAAALFSVVKGLGLGIALGTAASGAAIFASERDSHTAFVAHGKDAPAVQRARRAASSTPVEHESAHPPLAAVTSPGLRSPSDRGVSAASVGTRAVAPNEMRFEAQLPAPAVKTLSPEHDSSTAVAPASEANPLARSLELEVRALDRARQELAAGNVPRALATLAQYQRDFANGTLLPEAVFLRVRALIAVGQRTEAGALGQRFLSTRSTDADTRKLRQLLKQERLD